MKPFLTLLSCFVMIMAFSQDIVVTDYTGATTFDQYEEFTFDVTAQNTGIVAVNRYFFAAIYLSTDDKWDASDIALESLYFPASLGAGQSFTATLNNGTINTAPGTYYMIIKADHTSRVTETDESNNLFIIPNFTVNSPNVDFTFTTFTLDKISYTQNSVVMVSYILENLGSTNTGDLIYIRLALSADNIFDETDYYYHDVSLNLTGPDSFTSDDYSIALNLPTVSLGNYYIMAWVDRSYIDQGRFTETDEDNNIAAIPITITPSSIDLTINWAYTSFSEDGNLSADVFVKNNGTTDAGGYTIGAQLVPAGGTPDYAYGEGAGLFDNNLSAGGGKNHPGLHFFVSTPDPGTYYAVYKINFHESIMEIDYSNNIFIDYSTPIVITPPPVPGVTFNSLTLSNGVNDTDRQVHLNFNLTNSGNTTGFNQLYTITIKNEDNVTVHTEQVTATINFSPGQTVTKTFTLNLPAPLHIGTHQISATCISPIYTTPTQVTDNFDVTLTPYTLTGTVKSEDGSPITHGKLFLYQDDGNGTIKFIQKIVPYTGPPFTFSIDQHPHTLYFVPDPAVYPDHVPTIYGKTIVLQPENFFVATSNLDLELEVLKVSQLAPGSGIISGQVNSGGDNPIGRKGQPQTRVVATSSLPVVLISSTHQPVQITYTDANGSFEFQNLPRDTYEILICFELDQSQMNPFPVDITDKNMTINFDFTEEGVIASATQLYLPQTVSMSEFASFMYGDPSIIPDAQSDVGLPIEYHSSDESIATIINNEIVIKGVGTVLITALQAGNNFYQAASISRSLTINRGDQSITMSAIPVLRYGDQPYLLDGSSSSALSVSYFSSDPTIASIRDNYLIIHKPGSIELTVEQGGNEWYNSAVPVHQQIIIEKGEQSLSLDKVPSKTFGDPTFPIEATASSGLEVTISSSDPNIASVSGHHITIHSAGTVEIIAEQVGNEFYHPALPAYQLLTIEKSSQEIFFDALTDVSTDMGYVEFSATASSGLNVQFESSNDKVVSIDGSTATIHGEGITYITAHQSGNQNYLPAGTVTRELRVHLVLAYEEISIENQIYPNPTTDIVFVHIPNVEKIEITDTMGRIFKYLSYADSIIDLSELAPGVYFMIITAGGQTNTVRIIKR